MATNIIGISGKAGSGKDTVADYLVANHGFVRMALADEMKRFAKQVFDFSDQQLWGPSFERNAVDSRYDDPEMWEKAEDKLFDVGPEWCAKLLNGGNGPYHDRADNAWTELLTWFDNLNFTYGITWNEKSTLSARVMLQTIGTEWGRAQGQDIWVNHTMEMAKKLLVGGYVYSKENGLVDLSAHIEQHDVFPPQPKGVVVADMRFANELAAVKAVGGRTIRVKRPGIVLAQVGVAGHTSEAEQDTIPDTDFDHVLEAPEGLGNLAIVLTAFIPNILRSMS